MTGRAGHGTAAAAAAAHIQSYRWLSGNSEVQKVGVGVETGNSQSRPPNLVVHQSTAGSVPEQKGLCSLVPRTRFFGTAVIKWITTKEWSHGQRATRAECRRKKECQHKRNWSHKNGSSTKQKRWSSTETFFCQ